MRAVICKGDRTSHGGRVLEGNPNVTTGGRPIAQLGHATICPLCKGKFPIVEGVPTHTYGGKPTAVEGMRTACGATLIASQREMVIDARGTGSSVASSTPVRAQSRTQHGERKGGAPSTYEFRSLFGDAYRNAIREALSADNSWAVRAGYAASATILAVPGLANDVARDVLNSPGNVYRGVGAMSSGAKSGNPYQLSDGLMNASGGLLNLAGGAALTRTTVAANMRIRDYAANQVAARVTYKTVPTTLDQAILGLRNSSGDAAKVFARQISDMSTHVSGNVDRVVLGRWAENGGYIGEARTNGGTWYETDSSFFPKLTEGLDETVGRTKAWNVNEQFLQSQLEKGVGRLDLHGETITEVLVNRPNSFTAMEIKYLVKNAEAYGYTRIDNSWVKVK